MKFLITGAAGFIGQRVVKQLIEKQIAVIATDVNINNKSKIIVSELVLIGALSYLIFLAFNSATIYYYTVGEANKLDNNIKSERMLRISGTLKTNSFSK